MPRTPYIKYLFLGFKQGSDTYPIHTRIVLISIAEQLFRKIFSVGIIDQPYPLLC